VNKWKEIMTR